MRQVYKIEPAPPPDSGGMAQKHCGYDIAISHVLFLIQLDYQNTEIKQILIC